MGTFEDYIENWFEEFLGNIDETKCKELCLELGYQETDKDAEETFKDFLCGVDCSLIYNNVIINKPACLEDEEIDAEEILIDIFTDIVGLQYVKEYSFVKDFIEDMASEIWSSQYYPKDFFDDLLTHGCQSGIIGSLVYNDTCKKTYIENMDAMEDFKMTYEDENGIEVKNDLHFPHYTFMCWFCYEELAGIIARNLFPEDF